jgi:FKBP-type peptidyl-prolyl cis-trans isomerase
MAGLSDLPDCFAPAFDDDTVDDLFEFTAGTAVLRIDDDNAASFSSSKTVLEPLPPAVEDVLGDRGVLLERVNPPTDAKSPTASAERPFVELHYDATVVGGDVFDSTRDQNYPLIVQLDLPPSGNSTVVRAWEAALQNVRAGESVVVTAASRYAYGAEGLETSVPPNSDIRYDIDVLDVRKTRKHVAVVDRTEEDGKTMSRLEEVRLEREIAAQRRLDEQELKDAEKAKKAEKTAAIKAKLDAKRAGGGKKKGKKK